MELSARSSFIFVICLWKSNLLESKAFFTIRNFFNVRGVENAFYWPHNNLFCFCLLRTCALEKSPAVENRPFPSSKKSGFQSLVLKVRFFWTRKWPIGLPASMNIVCARSVYNVFNIVVALTSPTVPTAEPRIDFHRVTPICVCNRCYYTVNALDLPFTSPIAISLYICI